MVEARPVAPGLSGRGQLEDDHALQPEPDAHDSPGVLSAGHAVAELGGPQAVAVPIDEVAVGRAAHDLLALGEEDDVHRQPPLDGDDRGERVEERDVGALGAERPSPHQDTRIGRARDQLGAPGIVRPAGGRGGASVEHAVAVNGDRRPRVVDGPYAGVVAPLEDLHLRAAEVAVGLRHESGALADAPEVVPAHARLPHPAPHVLDVLVEVVVDVPVDRVAVHHVTSRARGRIWNARAGLSMSMAEMARSSIPHARSRGTKLASRWR